MSAAVTGRPIGEVRDLVRSFKSMMAIEESPGDDGEAPEGSEPVLVDPGTLGELGALQGVVKFPVRIKCSLLGWNTLLQALEEKP